MNSRLRSAGSLITVPNRPSLAGLRGHVSTTLPPCAASAPSTWRTGSSPFLAISSTTLLEPRPTMGSASPLDGTFRVGIAWANTADGARPIAGNDDSRARKSRRLEARRVNRLDVMTSSPLKARLSVCPLPFWRRGRDLFGRS